MWQWLTTKMNGRTRPSTLFLNGWTRPSTLFLNARMRPTTDCKVLMGNSLGHLQSMYKYSICTLGGTWGIIGVSIVKSLPVGSLHVANLITFCFVKSCVYWYYWWWWCYWLLNMADWDVGMHHGNMAISYLFQFGLYCVYFPPPPPTMSLLDYY